jgi:hypothetical protein
MTNNDKSLDGHGAAERESPSRGDGKHEGQHTFSFTYDDTGETVSIEAPNGWTMDRVVEEAYSELEEMRKPDDRVEFGGQILTAELQTLKVKAFVERGLNPSGKFHIVSKPGGAAR